MATNSWHWNHLLRVFWKHCKNAFPIFAIKDSDKEAVRKSAKNYLLIILSYWCCGLLLILFSPDLSFIMSFLSFFLLSSLLYEDRIVPLGSTFWFSLIQAPSFYLLVAFLNLAKTFSSSGSFAMSIICLSASFVAILVNVFYCQLAFKLNLRKDVGINNSLFEAFHLLTKKYKIFASASTMALLFALAGIGSTEVIILLAYPFWTLLSSALIEILLSGSEYELNVKEHPVAKLQADDRS